MLSGAFTPRRDIRHTLPHGGYTLNAAETHSAIDRSRPFIVDRESLHVKQVPITQAQFEQHGMDWETVR